MKGLAKIMTNRERDIYLAGLTSSLTLQLSIILNKDVQIDKSGDTYAETLEEARIWVAGFQDGNKLAYMISLKME